MPGSICLGGGRLHGLGLLAGCYGGLLLQPVHRTDEGFPVPVAGPIALGRACNFGLRLFPPAGVLE